MGPARRMHARNPYRTPPDFRSLALRYPALLRRARLDVNGQVHIDFQDPASLRALTSSLLHADFGLEVHIPEDRLVPTLPLRLNYVLWIEDLLETLEKRENVMGIDIGTGACAVYALLGATKNKWRMIGTETDTKSHQCALDNVRNNHLEHLVTIKYNSTSSLLEHLFAEDKNARYEFCMCNPPFYSSLQELCESRSADSRPPPKNGFTGSPQELITEGGELEFIRRLIRESRDLKDNVSVFTSMVGHKSSLKALEGELREGGVAHALTEFCQGRTTRWGLAWTYQPRCNLQLIVPNSECRKRSVPMTLVLPPLPGLKYDTETISKQVKHLLDKLSIEHKLVGKRGAKISMEIKAYTNTWSNQRRKRRQMKKLQEEGEKKIKLSHSEVQNIKESELVTNENNNIECELKESTSQENIVNSIKENLLLCKNVNGMNTEVLPSNMQNAEDGRSNMENTHTEPSASKPSGCKDEMQLEPSTSNQNGCKDQMQVEPSASNQNGCKDQMKVEPSASNQNGCKDQMKVEPSASNQNGCKDQMQLEPSKSNQNGCKDQIQEEPSTSNQNGFKDQMQVEPSKSNQNGCKDQIGSEVPPILHALLSIAKQQENIVLCLEYLSGSAGKDGMHQVVQYIKNNWK